MSRSIVSELMAVSFATLGHFLEDGFCDPELRRLTDEGRVVGRARTLELQRPDASSVDRCLLNLRPGDVLVVTVGAGLKHACVGEVTGRFALALGCIGVVVDGYVTDLEALNAMNLPVWGRGTTNLTTKRGHFSGQGYCGPVSLGGVLVDDNDIVLADGNGVVVLKESVARSIVPQAVASDAAEPVLLSAVTDASSARSVLRERLQEGSAGRGSMKDR